MILLEDYFDSGEFDYDDFTVDLYQSLAELATGFRLDRGKLYGSYNTFSINNNFSTSDISLHITYTVGLGDDSPVGIVAAHTGLSVSFPFNVIFTYTFADCDTYNYDGLDRVILEMEHYWDNVSVLYGVDLYPTTLTAMRSDVFFMNELGIEYDLPFDDFVYLLVDDIEFHSNGLMSDAKHISEKLFCIQ